MDICTSNNGSYCNFKFEGNYKSTCIQISMKHTQYIKKVLITVCYTSVVTTAFA